MTDDRKPEPESAEVAKRMAVLRRHLHDAVPLDEAATDAGISIRTARRWLARYRSDHPAGLARPTRPEAGKRTFAKELVELVEGIALLKPSPSIVTIHRRLAGIVGERQWRLPSYGSVRDIVRRIDPAMLTLAHEGAAAFRDKFELVHRHRADHPNAIWQADHTQLDILILDAGGRQVRPWLTTVLDDHSRVIAGYMVCLVREAARVLVDNGFRALGLHRIVSTCDVRNTASFGVMEKLGMHREGCFRLDRQIKGEWRDTYLYSILAEDWRGPA